jgi:membrane carboxypeptidase/penicillin-binding protein
MASITRLIIKRRRERKQKRRTQARQQLFLLVGVVAFVVFVVAPVGVVVGSVFVTYSDALARLPQPEETIFLDPAIGATELYDATGRTLLFAVDDPMAETRQWVDINTLPDHVPAATVLWEDPDFYDHADFSLWRLGGALWRNWTGDEPAPPVPSITGRIVRGVILQLPPDQPVSFDDRALEIALVAEIERQHSREDILEWHLNTNFYGNGAYGIEAAAQVYLGKSARDLTLDEAALLAAIPTAPRYNPADDETRARDRQSDLLRRMLSTGLITQSEFQTVINQQTIIQPNAGQTPDVAGDFALYAREQAETILNSIGLDGAQLVSRGGLRIITTLDLDLYDQADCILRAHLAQLRGGTVDDINTRSGAPCTALEYLPEMTETPAIVPPTDGNIVVIDAQTGEILTMNGITTQPLFQPGATLYPFIYLHGFINPEPNYTAASMVLDIPKVYPGAVEDAIYVPGNPNDQYYGPMSLRTAMGASLVPPAAQVANTLNINDVIRQTANRMGINTLRDGNYPLELLQRGGAVSALDVAYAYTAFAGLGEVSGVAVPPVAPGLRERDPVAVRRIEDAEGNVLWRYDETEIAVSRVPFMETRLAYLVNNILSDSDARREVFGTGNPFETMRPTAVVNGVSADQVDNWTVGYTPQRVLAVHLGRADRGATSLDGFALDGAALVWRALTDYIHVRDSLPATEWQMPDDIVQTTVCEISGMSATQACAQNARNEIFLDRGQFPPPDTYWEDVRINSQTQQQASMSTPQELINVVSFFIPPEEALDWWQTNDRPLPPEEVDTVSRPDFLNSPVILSPDNYDTIGGVIEIRGSLNADGMQDYQLQYGAGPNPTTWTNLTDRRTEFVANAPLAQWDTTGLDGTYILQLQVVRQDNSVENGFVQVIIDNVAPSIVLTLADDLSLDQPVQYPERQVIPLVADVTDNIRIDRVEFYVNGRFIIADDEFPYEYNHSIIRTGDETFTAVVYDSVGNSSEAAITVAVVRGN